MLFMSQDEFNKCAYVLAWAQDLEPQTSGPPSDEFHFDLHAAWRRQYPADTSLITEVTTAARDIQDTLKKAGMRADERTTWFNAFLLASDRFRSNGAPVDCRPVDSCPPNRWRIFLDDVPKMMAAIQKQAFPLLPYQAVLRAEMHGQLPQSERRTS